MLDVPGRSDCPLPRPYSYFRTEGADDVSFLIKRVGAGTTALLDCQPGDRVSCLGPLGNGFPDKPGAWLVAGGVGTAPFGELAGARTFVGLRSTADVGFARGLSGVPEIATDDGSLGFHGSVVDLFAHTLGSATAPSMVFTCGPTAMMAAVARLCLEREISCHVNLEAHMGCGFGVCRGCAHQMVSGWRCICEDGPVYDAREVFSA